MLRKKNSRDLILHTESQFYLPGDEIVGTVTYHPRKQVALRFVKIIFAGEEYCIWIDKAARVGGPVASSRAPLFRKETTLVSERTRVDPGPHTWQFRFTIPRSIPPTCNYYGKACVTYWLKAKAAAGFGHFSARSRNPVTIGQFWVPSIPAPISNTQSAAGGNILMTVKSSHSVVKCGDVVVLNVNFNNQSYRNLTGVRVKLKQVWECTGVFYHKNIVLKYLHREGFPTSRGPHNTTIQIKIPHRLQTCPTVTNASRFKCTYYLAVFGVTKMAGGLVATDTIKCRVPITITNLPSTDHESGEGSSLAQLPLRNEDSSDSDSESGSDSENDTFPRGLAQTISDSALGGSSGRNLPSTRSLGSLNSTTVGYSAAGSTANSAFEFLQDYQSRSQRQRDAQGSLIRRPNEGLSSSYDDSLGISDLFKDDEKDLKFDLKKSKEIDNKAEHDHNHNDDGDSPSKECIVCYDGQKNMLLLPCAHICTCVGCTSYIMYSSKMCPVCRTKINQVMRIYPV